MTCPMYGKEHDCEKCKWYVDVGELDYYGCVMFVVAAATCAQASYTYKFGKRIADSLERITGAEKE